MQRTESSIRVAILAAVAAVAVPAHAQQAEPTPEERRAALNREQAEFASNQLEQNAASQRAHDDAVKAREIQMATAQQEHERRLREHEEAMQRWRATVTACEAGDRLGCGVR